MKWPPRRGEEPCLGKWYSLLSKLLPKTVQLVQTITAAWLYYQHQHSIYHKCYKIFKPEGWHHYHTVVCTHTQSKLNSHSKTLQTAINSYILVINGESHHRQTALIFIQQWFQTKGQGRKYTSPPLIHRAYVPRPPSGCLKPYTEPNSIYTMSFPIHIYLLV